jgi:hypothetical protein
MTLIEALQELKSFSEDLYSIIEKYNYDGYDKFLEQRCSSLSNYLNNFFIAIEKNLISDIWAIIADIQKQYRGIYYITELNPIFEDNGIKYFNIQQTETLESYVIEHFEEIKILLSSCQENYQSIYQLMNQKFADRFYNR